MKDIWSKNKVKIVTTSVVLFCLILLIVFANSSKEVNNTIQKEYKTIMQTIKDNVKIYRVVSNIELTEDKMKEIYENYSEDDKEIKIWFFDNDTNAKNLESYNVAEIKKENGEYKIHRYGEETEEEKAIRLEKERIAKEEEEKKKEEERLKKEAEEKARKEEEEKNFKTSCKEYTFEELARNPDKIKGSKVKLMGKVIQTMYGTLGVNLRVNITKKGSYSTYYTDTIYVTYYPKEGEDKILEDDIITIWGTSYGDTSYTSTIGATITLPYISAKYITINE